jgi:hypothetical protein
MATRMRKPEKERKATAKRDLSKSAAVERPAKRKAAAMTTPAASMEAAAWGAPLVRSPSGADTPTRAQSAGSDPPGYDDLFKLPYAHALMNANLATIKMVDPDHPSDPVIRYEGNGVRADIVNTGIAGTKSQSPATTGYGIPAVATVQDIRIYDGDEHECLVLSTIPFPFAAGTTEAHAITRSDQRPDLINNIIGYVIDQTMTGALIAAANATGQQFDQTPRPTITIHDQLFWRFDKAIRTSVGDEINVALGALNAPIPFEITTGDLMAPFLVFSVTAFDKNRRTIDIQFNSVGFSTMLRTVDPESHQVILGTALSLQASGQGHISEAGVDLNLNYKVNTGSGLLPLASQYAALINGALIPKLEGFMNKFFPPQLDGMLFVLGGFPLAMTPLPLLLSAPQRLGNSSLRWADSAKRRSASLIP